MTQKQKPRKSRRPGRPPRDREDVGREALLDAARRLLRRTDPAAVTRQMVAAEAGVDPNLIRYYFGNMTQMLVEVALRTNQLARAEMAKDRNTLSMDERLQRKIRRTFHLFSDNPFLHKLVTMVLTDKSQAKAYAQWNTTIHDAVEDVADAIGHGGRPGSTDPDMPKFVHLLIISACEFWSNNQKIIDIIFGEKDRDKITERYLAFILDLVVRGIEAPMPLTTRGGRRSSMGGARASVRSSDRS